jgi:hypothetical protein
MPRLAAFFAIALLACSSSDSGPLPGRAGGNPAQWRFSSGRAPTRAEYLAVVATCEEGAIAQMRGRPIDACLADLGLRRRQR